ncbi:MULTISPECIES: SgcJ/EcaC family oxidoreductase [unclassified Pseudomonas]|uniref:SgcJ/EcaC family oxidoreductase n=2 Tax=unclassified Pseudomonas TaxID=196821 RepID=UPI002A36AD54|nr:MULTISPECIES: SgcJ/EcaC family oxidoreductase [unclassified Pseudomonas]MDX9669466.1 SgcJ/EcaC family oxidoreductase [Pseudomonas sp. P8_250]WPN36496.1 SgcJ/EcaC family oxidoreductase [Pseudomonas sp. P8_139]WPN41703.1 SgcJ/EcaC family oxidoreductase [Pseudomonas sp. P8_229]
MDERLHIHAEVSYVQGRILTIGERSAMTQMKNPEDVPGAFQTAWNTHDMPALGALFDPQATFVNRFGHFVRGIEEIVALHAPIHQTIYRDSTLENALIDVDHVADGVAIVHFWSRLSAGAAHPAGAHAVDTLILAVLTRHNEAWRIRALENVTLTNPRTGEAILRE